MIFEENNWIESHSLELIVMSLILCAILLMAVVIYLAPNIDKTITAGCTITTGSILTKCITPNMTGNIPS
jgi:hypothetical protein